MTMSRNLPNSQAGLTLVELMIAMTLGLFLLLGLTNVFLAQRQSFRVNENLSQMQNNTRVAFELMAREIREAGGNPCGTTQVANVVNGASTSSWLDWDTGGILGYESNVALPGKAFGTTTGARVAGTDAVTIRTGSMNNNIVITEHDTASAQFKVNTTAHGIADGDMLMVCDYKQAAIFQVTSASATNVTIVHNTGTGVPGNCSKGLGFPTDCSSVTGNQYDFSNNGFLTKFRSTAWYVGNNAQGGRSLFRIVNGATGAPEEIAQGVTDMQLQYLTRTGTNPAGSYVDASAVTSWDNPPAATQVVAVRVVLDLESRDAVGTDAATLKRQMMHVVSLRHREIVE
ncbi:PilW family protein [Parazoarcus communis]|nr:PilW family protein [Parazoarcus communis]